ncbi:hypothetical protein B6N60_03098 [Richelia sinica FACHB-800]|uniref:Uncharacterized protein n=1 Tax=Richelia sinica FACHB-800 TaxID=1357546 RepID=A0A975T8Y1_9NOST|nr:hypothetical protein B6N60_03098 [Richelia sinica FACHB-800]
MEKLMYPKEIIKLLRTIQNFFTSLKYDIFVIIVNFRNVNAGQNLRYH